MTKDVTDVSTTRGDFIGNWSAWLWEQRTCAVFPVQIVNHRLVVWLALVVVTPVDPSAWPAENRPWHLDYGLELKTTCCNTQFFNQYIAQIHIIDKFIRCINISEVCMLCKLLQSKIMKFWDFLRNPNKTLPQQTL